MMFLILVMILTFTSCTKTKNQLFKGYYSFKTSGTVLVQKKVCDSLGNQISFEETNISVDTENGQMNILSVDEKTGEMIVTMNVIDGDIIKYDAIADETTLTIDNQKRNIKLEKIELSSMKVNVSGVGKKYDNNVVFDLKYHGSHTETVLSRVITYTIIDSEINCVARSND